MCVNIISEELIAEEDITVYKVVYDNHGFQSQFTPEGRTPQNQTGNNGTILYFRINQLTESPFTYSEGIYTYVIEPKHVSHCNLPRDVYCTKILRCVVPKGTKYKKATYMLIDCMLVEKLIPLEAIICV